ncbi:MAG: phosphoribosylglycinamide formyltransferase [Verrucomicrobiota bacterium]
MAVSFLSDWDEVVALRNQLDSTGQKLVLTNGVFDVLHVGHTRYLAEARALGDALIVAINGDQSVRELKGPGRPINRAGDRAEVLCALESVDRVVIFEERRASAVIEAIRPHIYTKGGDYTADSLIDEEKALLDRLDIEIQILSLVAGKSTSATLSRMAKDEETLPRIAIFGSGQGSNAQAILEAIGSGQLLAECAAIFTDAEKAPIAEVAREYDVPLVKVDPGTTRGGYLTNAALKELTDRLTAMGVDLVVLAGFMRILRDPLLTVFEGRVLNIHPSLLPEYPGLRAVERALESGANETGTTIHLVDAGIDTGKILRQEAVSIEPGDSSTSLTEKIKAIEHRIFPQVIGELLAQSGKGSGDQAG